MNIKRNIKEGVNVDQAFLKSFMMDAIKNPRKFYNLLLISGMKGTEAYRIMYNLKHPKIASTSYTTRMRMMALLQNIIELVTNDRIMYSRLRSLATSGDLEHLGKHILPSGSYNKHGKKMQFDGIDEDTSYTTSTVDGVVNNGETDRNPPAPFSLTQRIAAMFRRKRQPKGGQFNLPIHGGY